VIPIDVGLVLDIVAFFCTYLIISLSLNFEQGYTGLFNLGLYFPVLAGALIVAYLPGRLAMMIYKIDPSLDFSANNAFVLDLLRTRLEADPLTSILLLAVTLVSVMAICALLGYISAQPAMKLSEDYLAMFYLSLAETLRVIGMQTPWLAGGVMGITVINPFWWLGSNTYYGMVLFIIVSTAFIAFTYYKICGSPLGRALKSVRDNNLTAECIGKDVHKIKKKVMAFSFAFLGVGGALQAFSVGAVVADGYSRVDYSFWPWLMMIVGGSGNNLGVLVGTFALVMMRRAMIVGKQYLTFLPFDIIYLEPILLAIMLAVTLAFRPEGLVPDKSGKIDRYIKKIRHQRSHAKEQSTKLVVSG
jgi:branched-chain amino acid transport system permease protein